VKRDPKWMGVRYRLRLVPQCRLTDADDRPANVSGLDRPASTGPISLVQADERTITIKDVQEPVRLLRRNNRSDHVPYYDTYTKELVATCSFSYTPQSSCCYMYLTLAENTDRRKYTFWRPEAASTTALG